MWCEPKDWNPPSDVFCLHAVVPVSGVNVLSERVQACAVVGIGDLFGYEFLVDQLAFGVRLRVVLPPEPAAVRSF